MTLDQIDAALSGWRARLAQAADSLLELDGNAAYQRLRPSTGQPPVVLTGRTLARIGPILPLIDGLWQTQSQLTDSVNQAEKLRVALKRLWVHEADQREIEFLLLGESILLPAVDMPFAQRGLLSAPAPVRGMTLEQLLSQMTRNYALVKDAVLTLGGAWDTLGQKLAEAEREMADLDALAKQLGLDVSATLTAAHRELTALHDRVASDPLGASADFTTSLNSQLTRIRTQLTATKQRRDQLDADLRRADKWVSELDALQKSCQAAQAECIAKIANFSSTLPFVPNDLAGWLRSVEAARQSQQWKSAQIGLTRWFQAADAAHEMLSGFLTSSTAMLERREELRGLLRALQAKATAQEARGVPVPPDLAALALRAEALLHGRPTPLDEAAALVSEYERRLVAG